MNSAQSDVLTILKTELAYLEHGGYRNSTHTHWYPKLIFQDSPTCINFHHPVEPRPCSECSLMQFVPLEQKGEKIPCRHIILNEQGATLDSMYRFNTLEEAEATVAQWLRSAIQHIERKQGPQESSASAGAEIAKGKSAVH